MIPAHAETFSPPEADEGRRSHALEWAVLLHVVGLLLFTAWDFGGETDFARVVIEWWGSLAVPITVAVCVRELARRDRLPPALHWLWPLLLFDGLVLAGTLHPSFTYAIVGGTAVLVQSGSDTIWPSSALPAASLHELWQFNAIYLTCFNLVLAVRRRRVLRLLLLIFVADALLLAVFGTFQKLARAPGLFFGLQRSPNPTFFASFIYHNHWGAFTVLATAAALGLLFHHARHGQQDDRRHSPALFGLVATLFIAASVPLSTSRSGTVLLLVLLTGALFCWLRLRHRRAETNGGSLFLQATLSVGVFAIGLGAIFLLGRPAIEARLDTTRHQVEELRRRGDFGARQQLYADTWHMARAKLWFGWGLGSYATVFRIYSTQRAVEPWFGRPFYAEAHSDWLQSVAEVGLAGTAVLVCIGLLPLVAVLRQHPPWGALPRALLVGCGLIILYAWVEFPFANPAVLLAFWFCFFLAIRYAQLDSQHRP